MTDPTPDRRGPLALAALRRAWPFLAGWAVVFGAELGVYRFTNSKGVTVTGDEPHYLVAARALTHFTPHVIWAYRLDFRTHSFYNWPAGAATSRDVMHLWNGPHGPVSAHFLGLPALLMPFVAVGGRTVAFAGLFAIEAVGFVYLHQRASWLAGLSRRGKVVFALTMAAPATWVAATQIYPDLLTGILLACAVVEIGVVEREHRIGPLGAVVFAATIGYLPWLHVKNLVPGAIACIAFGWVAARAAAWRGLAIVAAVIAVSWALQFAYNLYYFGHLLGLPQPTPSVNSLSLTDMAGLLFDRHQGLLVQVPTVLVGIGGFWLARRIVPAAALAAVVAVAAVIFFNGTYTTVPYGGGALAGRFEWTAVPVLLAGCPYLIVRLEAFLPRLAAAASGVLLVWMIQLIPIARGEHTYYNVLYPKPGWDPSHYPGWWGPFDVILPEYASRNRVFGTPWFALAIELLAAAGAVALALRLASPAKLRLERYIPAMSFAVIAAVVLTVVVPRPLPGGPLSFSDRDLGGPLVATNGTQLGPEVALQGVAKGRFRLDVSYSLTGQDSSGAGSGAVNVKCVPRHPANAAPTPFADALSPSGHDATIDLHCPSGTIDFQMIAGPGATLAVDQLLLSKVAN